MSTTYDLHRVESRAHLLDLTDHDPFVAHDVPRQSYETAWVAGHAVAIFRMRQSGTQRGISVVGPADDEAVLLRQLPSVVDLRDIDTISVDRDRLALLTRSFDGSGWSCGPGGDWDWLWTTTEPPRISQEDDLALLDDLRDAPDVLALNEIGNPSAESQPGEGRSERWVGLREGGALVAAAAMQRTAGGIPHLAGITVAPTHRGRHLGLAMTAALTRYAVRTEGICSLGMYADNDVARGLYTRLGYRVAHAWASRRLTPADSEGGAA